MKTSRLPTPARIGLALAVVIAAVAAASALLAPTRRPATTASALLAPMRRPATTAIAVTPGNGAAGANTVPVTMPRRPIQGHLTEPAPEIAKARPRSPLERSPGYFPPDDPESMSVITGHREAPLVSLKLTGGASSIDDLGRSLITGINARDERAIHALGVTRDEFEVILWREFPESRPVTHITAADAWEMSSIQSLSGVSRTVGTFGNRKLEFIRVACGPPDAFRNFSLYRAVEIVTRDPATAQEVRLRFAPSFVERHGRFKVLTFRDR